MAKITLANIVKVSDLSLLNSNFKKLSDALNLQVLYRNNPAGENNAVLTDIDVNGKRLYNLPRATSDSQAATLADVKAYASVGGPTPTTINWGSIGGSIGTQADLVALLAGKQSLLPVSGDPTNVLRGDLTWAPLPSGGGGSGPATWGFIGGNLASQTDLITLLSSKQDLLPNGTTGQYLTGIKTWATLNKAAVGLTNVDNTTDVNKPVSTAQAAAIALKAPLASPEFTGVPKVPTAVVGTSTTQVASTGFVAAAISGIVAGNGEDAAFATLVAVANYLKTSTYFMSLEYGT